MEMCYDGALVMPSSYAVMSEDEMMYTEGGGLGKHWYNKTSFIATVIDGLVFAASVFVGCGGGQIVKRFMKQPSVQSRIMKIVQNVCIQYLDMYLSATMANRIVSVMKGLSGISISSIAVAAINLIDGDGTKNYLFA